MREGRQLQGQDPPPIPHAHLQPQADWKKCSAGLHQPFKACCSRSCLVQAAWTEAQAAQAAQAVVLSRRPGECPGGLGRHTHGPLTWSMPLQLRLYESMHAHPRTEQTSSQTHVHTRSHKHTHTHKSARAQNARVQTQRARACLNTGSAGAAHDTWLRLHHVVHTGLRRTAQALAALPAGHGAVTTPASVLVCHALVQSPPLLMFWFVMLWCSHHPCLCFGVSCSGAVTILANVLVSHTDTHLSTRDCRQTTAALVRQKRMQVLGTFVGRRKRMRVLGTLWCGCSRSMMTCTTRAGGSSAMSRRPNSRFAAAGSSAITRRTYRACDEHVGVHAH